MSARSTRGLAVWRKNTSWPRTTHLIAAWLIDSFNRFRGRHFAKTALTHQRSQVTQTCFQVFHGNHPASCACHGECCSVAGFPGKYQYICLYTCRTNEIFSFEENCPKLYMQQCWSERFYGVPQTQCEWLMFGYIRRKCPISCVILRTHKIREQPSKNQYLCTNNIQMLYTEIRPKVDGLMVLPGPNF